MKVLAILALIVAVAWSSSHSEAPGTVTSPRADIVDFYAFTSYEAGRSNFVTFLMNVNPLQETFGGPNYSPLPSDYVFNIHVDNDGDATEDITFQFMPGANFSGTFDAAQGIHGGLMIPVPIAGGAGSRMVKVPLGHIGVVTQADETQLNFKEHYKMRVFTGASSANANVDAGPFATAKTAAPGVAVGSDVFRKPFDYAGTKTFADYSAYSNSFITQFNYPGGSAACMAATNKVFVGQRREPFVVNLGQIFDLIAMVPVVELGGSQDSKFNVLSEKAVTTFAVEVSKDCLKLAATPAAGNIIGTWSSVQHLTHDVNGVHMAGSQKNRLGNPLVNEAIIGLTDKNRFNAQHPSRDSDFLLYFEYPTLPELVEVLWGNTVRGAVPSVTTSIAPNNYPRVDVREVLLRGIPNVNRPTIVTEQPACNITNANPPFADMLRLNMDIAPTVTATQNSYGVVAMDNAGYPNGRRPGDDVIDIVLNVAMGKLCHFAPNAFGCNQTNAPAGGFTATDRAPINATMFMSVFPYLNVPVAGSQLRCGQN